LGRSGRDIVAQVMSDNKYYVKCAERRRPVERAKAPLMRSDLTWKKMLPYIL